MEYLLHTVQSSVQMELLIFLMCFLQVFQSLYLRTRSTKEVCFAVEHPNAEFVSVWLWALIAQPQVEFPFQ